jgi:hypothetical protein
MDEEYHRWIHDQGTTESDAREEGYRAYQDGLMSDDNPYIKAWWEWDLHLAWQEGFGQAAWDD